MTDPAAPEPAPPRIAWGLIILQVVLFVGFFGAALVAVALEFIGSVPP